jgi:SAM-dependent methyltransferase
VSEHPFVGEAAATRYAAGRPDYGPHLAEVFRRLLPPHHILDLAVDVGCGTGISTAPLLAVARWAVGVDPSLPMLTRAEPGPRRAFVAGRAERLPLADDCADLVAAGSAFHWFDRERFAAEAVRIARGAAWLVVHHHWFAGRMRADPRFGCWVRDTYLARYPTPPRRPRLEAGEDLGAFAHVTSEDYEQTVEVTRDELVTYLVTQSNVGVVVDAGEEDLDRVVTWLDDELTRFVPDGCSAAVDFGGRVSLLHRV